MTLKSMLLATIIIGGTLLSCGETTVETATLDKELTELINKSNPKGIKKFILPEPTDFANIPQEPANPLNTKKVALGKMLFYETGLGVDSKFEQGKQTYSCGTCHLPEIGLLPGFHQGFADGGLGYGHRTIMDGYEESDVDVQENRPMSLYNVGFMTNTLWNGRFGARDANVGTEHLWGKENLTDVNELGYSGLEVQNVEGLKLHRQTVNKALMTELGYKELFDQAFPEKTESQRYTLITGSFALSAYLRTLMTTEAPFQNWLKGDKDALTDNQKKGAKLFYSKARCIVCHDGPAFSSNRFFAMGVKDMYQRADCINNQGAIPDRVEGRGSFTKKDEDKYKFKVPQLYNLKGNTFFFHGSSKSSIKEVIEYKNLAKYENPVVDTWRQPKEFQALSLTEDEISQLEDFIVNGLYDPNVVAKYKPTEVASGNCIPSSDWKTKQELGCE